MALDRIDAASIVGFALLAASALVLEQRLVVAAAFGGFLLSLSIWRLYGGRPWEALGWLAWVGAAATLAVGLDSALLLTAFFGFGLVGVMLLLGGRTGILRDVWSVDASEERV